MKRVLYVWACKEDLIAIDEKFSFENSNLSVWMTRNSNICKKTQKEEFRCWMSNDGFIVGISAKSRHSKSLCCWYRSQTSMKNSKFISLWNVYVRQETEFMKFFFSIYFYHLLLRVTYPSECEMVWMQMDFEAQNSTHFLSAAAAGLFTFHCRDDHLTRVIVYIIQKNPFLRSSFVFKFLLLSFHLLFLPRGRAAYRHDRHAAT